MQKSLLLKDIVQALGGKIVGNPDVLIRRVASIKSAKPDDLVFLGDPRLRGEILNTRASAVIIRNVDAGLTKLPCILTDNPYSYFAKVAELFNPPEPLLTGVSETAIISETAKVSTLASIGPGVIICDDAIIDAGADIQAGCFIGSGVKIGASTKIYPNTTIRDACVIGANVVIHSNAVIGADGFGLARDGDQWIKIPQIGKVIIGDECEIGAGTTIDRGALDDTIISSGVKLDNQIQIGHNCSIGENTAIAACVGIAGSVAVGRNCQIGGGTLISGHLSIGDNIVISGGTFVSKSLKTSGRYTGVFPTSSHQDWKKNASLIRNLRKMFDMVRNIKKVKS